MIGALTGRIIYLNAPLAILDVQGTGYEIETPLSTFCQLKTGEQVTLWTHQVVREDAHLLYGFLQQSDKALFRQLIRVNGVGPKLALSILSAMSADMLIQSIDMQDLSMLTRIPGVGKKTAERLVIELRDRLQALAVSGNSEGMNLSQITLGSPSPTAEAEAALVSLGYKPLEAQKAIRAIRDTLPAGLSAEQEASELIRAALKGMIKS